eukprot:COSAG01_NODE_6819_length_3483_cov_24.232565_6_plen_79_part_00
MQHTMQTCLQVRHPQKTLHLGQELSLACRLQLPTILWHVDKGSLPIMTRGSKPWLQMQRLHVVSRWTYRFERGGHRPA